MSWSIRIGVRLLSALGIAMTGCSSPGPFDGSISDLMLRDFGSVSASERALIERASGGAFEPWASDVELPTDASAADFVRLALDRNPTLRAARQRVLRLQQRIPQVESLADPMLQIAPFGQMAETAAGQVSVMTGISQRIPYPGKLAARGRIAGQDAAIAEQELERLRLSVVSDTRTAYWSLYYAARAIEVTRQSRDLLVQMREVVRAKYRVGAATQESVLRTAVALNSLENELITLDQRRTTAVAMLNSLIDRSVTADLADPRPIELSEFDLRLDDLLSTARLASPMIGVIRERMQRFLEQRELARLNRYPDLTVGLSYNLVDDQGLSPVANGDDQWWIGFGINLPIWQPRLKAAELEAMRGILETAGLVAGEQNRVAFRVQDAYAKVETHQRQVILLRDVIVPEARQTVEASLSGYRAGSVGYLSLIDNWRKLLDFQLMYQRSLADLERAFAELQEAVGRDVPRTRVLDDADEPRDNDTESPEPDGGAENDR